MKNLCKKAKPSNAPHNIADKKRRSLFITPLHLPSDARGSEVGNKKAEIGGDVPEVEGGGYGQ